MGLVSPIPKFESSIDALVAKVELLIDTVFLKLLARRGCLLILSDASGCLPPRPLLGARAAITFWLPLGLNDDTVLFGVILG